MEDDSRKVVLRLFFLVLGGSELPQNLAEGMAGVRRERKLWQSPM